MESSAYDGHVHVRPDSTDEDIDVTIDAGVELANAIAAAARPAEVRVILTERTFMKAPAATDTEIDDVVRRFAPVAAIIETLPDAELDLTVARINQELAASNVAPSLVAHDGTPLHIHWTTPQATFSHQVTVDVLMALGQALCQHGIARFGRCSAEWCDRLFYDTTRNRSRRFCSDPRCASRTHTARHRARRRSP